MIGNYDGNYDGGRRKLRVLGKGHKVVLLTVPFITVRTIEQYVAQLRNSAPEAPLIQSVARPGRGISPQTVYWIVTRVAERAGVRTWPHALRHTAVTEVAREEGLHVAQQFARHSDVRTTMIYVDNVEDLAGKGAEVMAQILDDGNEKGKGTP